jgi:predicted DNA-binding transcriptional regulator YafY
MSVIRIKYIIEKLDGNRYVSLAEILSYLKRLDNAIPSRTFYRDLYKIEFDYGFEILRKRISEGNRRVMGYRIEGSENINYEDTISYLNRVSAVELLRSKLGTTVNLAKYISSGKGKSSGGALWLDKVILAMTGKNQLHFSYTKYDDPIPSHRLVDPHFLKSHNQTWYVLAREVSSGLMKLYGLDRVTDLQITDVIFQRDPDFSPEDYFGNYLGVFTDNTIQLETIIIEIHKPFAGKVRMSPMHESQEIIEDTSDIITIRLQIALSSEFYTEMLKMRNYARIITPEHARLSMKEIVEKMVLNYA